MARNWNPALDFAIGVDMGRSWRHQDEDRARMRILQQREDEQYRQEQLAQGMQALRSFYDDVTYDPETDTHDDSRLEDPEVIAGLDRIIKAFPVLGEYAGLEASEGEQFKDDPRRLVGVSPLPGGRRGAALMFARNNSPGGPETEGGAYGPGAENARVIPSDGNRLGGAIRYMLAAYDPEGSRLRRERARAQVIADADARLLEAMFLDRRNQLEQARRAATASELRALDDAIAEIDAQLQALDERRAAPAPAPALTPAATAAQPTAAESAPTSQPVTEREGLARAYRQSVDRLFAPWWGGNFDAAVETYRAIPEDAPFMHRVGAQARSSGQVVEGLYKSLVEDPLRVVTSGARLAIHDFMSGLRGDSSAAPESTPASEAADTPASEAADTPAQTPATAPTPVPAPAQTQPVEDPERAMLVAARRDAARLRRSIENRNRDQGQPAGLSDFQKELIDRVRNRTMSMETALELSKRPEVGHVIDSVTHHTVLDKNGDVIAVINKGVDPKASLESRKASFEMDRQEFNDRRNFIEDHLKVYKNASDQERALMTRRADNLIARGFDYRAPGAKAAMHMAEQFYRTYTRNPWWKFGIGAKNPNDYDDYTVAIIAAGLNVTGSSDPIREFKTRVADPVEATFGSAPASVKNHVMVTIANAFGGWGVDVDTAVRMTLEWARQAPQEFMNTPSGVIAEAIAQQYRME